MSAATEPGLAQLYRLYRQVLRVHRDKLPAPLRSLGDSYVKSEIRRHLAGKTSQQQWREFGDQWGAYVSMLAGRADADEAQGGVAALHEADLGALNAEQQEQLQKLRGAALELGGKGGDGGSCGGGGASSSTPGSGA